MRNTREYLFKILGRTWELQIWRLTCVLRHKAPIQPGKSRRRRRHMRPKFWRLAHAMVALALALVVPNALAQCMLSRKVVTPASCSTSPLAGQRLVQAAVHKSDDDDDDPSIVGMWHVVFTAQTLNGTPVKLGFA